jgi:hypothetical protein
MSGISVVVDVEIRSLNRLSNENPLTRSRRRRREKARVRLALTGRRPPPGPWQVVITRIGPRKLDSDNLSIGAKAIRDCVADFLGCDDGDDNAVVWAYRTEIQRVKVPAWQGRWKLVPARLKVWTKVEIATRSAEDARSVVFG